LASEDDFASTKVENDTDHIGAAPWLQSWKDRLAPTAINSQFLVAPD
jgi:hypothetical protein